MAEILVFPVERIKERSRGDVRPTGEVVWFTGVRIEYHGPEGEARGPVKPSGRPRRRAF